MMLGALENVEPNEEQKNKMKKSSFMSWVYFFLLLAGIYFFFQYIVGITVVSGNSMEPTMENQDILITSNLFYTPERNDIIIFLDDNGFDVIKRIIALPNETIEIRNGVVFVNDTPVNETFTAGMPNDMDKTTVNEGEYFVMGDNRTPGESLDSRNNEIGNIHKEKVKGEVLISFFPFHTTTTSGK